MPDSAEAAGVHGLKRTQARRKAPQGSALALNRNRRLIATPHGVVLGRMEERPAERGSLPLLIEMWSTATYSATRLIFWCRRGSLEHCLRARLRTERSKRNERRNCNF